VIVIEFLPLIPTGLPSRAFFDRLRDSIETASDRLIDEALAKDPTLAPLVEKNRRSEPGTPRA
jgi:1-acyl-sn-glycerol-3-phosphate acyltransferase